MVPISPVGAALRAVSVDRVGASRPPRATGSSTACCGRRCFALGNRGTDACSGIRDRSCREHPGRGGVGEVVARRLGGRREDGGAGVAGVGGGVPQGFLDRGAEEAPPRGLVASALGGTKIGARGRPGAVGSWKNPFRQAGAPKPV